MCHCVHLRFTFQICKDIQPLLCVQPKKRNVKCEYVSHSHFFKSVSSVVHRCESVSSFRLCSSLPPYDATMSGVSSQLQT